MSLRILMITNLFPPDVLGGYELLAADVVRELRSRGHAVDVLTSGRPRASDANWVHRRLALVRPFGTPVGRASARHALLARSHRDAVRRLQVERGPFDAVVVMSLRRMGFHALRPLVHAGHRPVFCLNDAWPLAFRPRADPRTRLGRLLSTVLDSASWNGVAMDRCVFVSAALRRRIEAAGVPVKGVVCRQGVDTAQFVARPPQRLSRAPRLLFVGRLHRDKACDVAIDACSQLRRRGLQATLTIVGTGEAAERARLEDRVRTQNVQGAVAFDEARARRELPAIYRGHDVLLFPSRWQEPAGLVPLEALACGLPVVAHPTGGACEVLSHEDNCLVAPDGLAMARSVARLFRSPELVRRLHRGGLETTRHTVSLAGYVQGIERELALAAHASRSARTMRTPLTASL